MLRNCYLLFKALRIVYIFSKHRLLANNPYPSNNQLKLLAYLINILFYPPILLSKTTQNFGKRLAQALQQLGPVYIKFGQTLSTRPDLITPEVAQELQYLQDKLPPVQQNIAIKYLEQYLPDKISIIFSEFNYQPVAAASIAQVYKAKLIDGKNVAVKMLRPNIRQKYYQDIEILQLVARIISFWVKKTKRLRLLEVVAIFRKTMQQELDLRLEAAAASQVADNFAQDATLIVPEVFWHLTSQNILVTEWLDGISIYDKPALLAANINLQQVAAKLATIFFNQAYRDGFFHADLHPGNILVCANGNIGLIDFGIIGILPTKDRLAIAQILHAFLKRDYHQVALLHKQAGYVPMHTDLSNFALSCRAVAEPIIGLATKNISIGKLLAQLFQITDAYGMETQPQLLLLQKTMVVIEGIGQQLDININMWQLAEPWIKEWAIKNISPEAKIARFIKTILEQIVSATNLPNDN